MQNNRHKSRIKKGSIFQGLLSILDSFDMFARLIIIIVVLFILGQNLKDPSLFDKIVIDFCLLVWACNPLIKLLIKNGKS